MLVPLSWLREYVDITLPTAELAERLTLAGHGVDAIEKIGDWWDAETLIVGEVLAVLPHPDADRLSLVDVDFGSAEPDRVVTGAPNIFAHRGKSKADGSLPTMKVAFARVGATLVDAYSEEKPRPKKKLKSSKIRGIPSNGMVCSERELGLSEEHEGILELPANAPVGVPLRDYLGDEILLLDLTPDMARCLNIIGVAREVAALTAAPLHLPADECQQTGNDAAADWVAVEIAAPDLCNRYTGMIIEGIKIGPSPKWMQDRLTKAGMRPISNIVDITNYVMLEWGQPLHAFDYDTLKARAQGIGEAQPVIVVKRAQAGETFTTLDNVKRTLDDSMLMICDRAGSVAIAGVMGGLESEVTDNTVNILLEAATFHAINNRRTANKLLLPSEASRRFTRGIPASLNPIGARRAAELMRLYAGGRVVPGMVDTYPVSQEIPTVYTTLSDMRRILGLEVSLEEVKTALLRLDFTVAQLSQLPTNASDESVFALHYDAGEAVLACVPPWYRLDIRIPADLIEEVARVIGYESVGTTLMDDVMPTQWRSNITATEEKVRDILVGAGLQEIINYALSSPENHDKLVVSSDGKTPLDAYVTLANPIAPERRVMRRSMLVSALENLERNLRFTNRLTTFEIGRVYLPEKGDGTLPLEEGHAVVLLAGPRQPHSFYTPSSDSSEQFDFYDIKGSVESLLDRLGFKPEAIEFRAKPDAESFGPRCAALYVGGQVAGLVGEIHPKVRAAFGLPNLRVCIADLLIAPLVRPAWSFEPMKPISVYMPVIEDFAFEVAEEVTVRRVEEIIRKAGGALVSDVELFDVYRGQNVQIGNKSLAYRVTYQSQERNLAEKDVEKLRRGIIYNVERETGGKLRV